MARFSELKDRALFAAPNSSGLLTLYQKHGDSSCPFTRYGGLRHGSLELLPEIGSKPTGVAMRSRFLPDDEILEISLVDDS